MPATIIEEPLAIPSICKSLLYNLLLPGPGMLFVLFKTAYGDVAGTREGIDLVWDAGIP